LEHSDEYGDTELEDTVWLDEVGEMLAVDIPGQDESLW